MHIHPSRLMHACPSRLMHERMHAHQDSCMHAHPHTGMPSCTCSQREGSQSGLHAYQRTCATPSTPQISGMSCCAPCLASRPAAGHVCCRLRISHLSLAAASRSPCSSRPTTPPPPRPSHYTCPPAAWSQQAVKFSKQAVRFSRQVVRFSRQAGGRAGRQAGWQAGGYALYPLTCAVGMRSIPAPGGKCSAPRQCTLALSLGPAAARAPCTAAAAGATRAHLQQGMPVPALQPAEARCCCAGQGLPAAVAVAAPCLVQMWVTAGGLVVAVRG